jgi:hypothetical protein
MAAREKPGPPMTLANMRKNGIRAVIAICKACGHKADVDALPETIFVPNVGRRLRCRRYETRMAYEMTERSQKKPRGLRGSGGAEAARSGCGAKSSAPIPQTRPAPPCSDGP